MPGQPGQNTRPHAKLPPSFLDMDACATSQMDIVLVRKLLCAWLIFDVIRKCLYVQHWQTSGQLVQELHFCTVPWSQIKKVVLKLLSNPYDLGMQLTKLQ